MRSIAEAEGGMREGWTLRRRFRLFKRLLSGCASGLIPELVDAWYRQDNGIDEELAPARMWRGQPPDGARLIEGAAGEFDRVVKVDGPPARFYAFRVEADGKRRLAAVWEAANT